MRRRILLFSIISLVMLSAFLFIRSYFSIFKFKGGVSLDKINRYVGFIRSDPSLLFTNKSPGTEGLPLAFSELSRENSVESSASIANFAVFVGEEPAQPEKDLFIGDVLSSDTDIVSAVSSREDSFFGIDNPVAIHVECTADQTFLYSSENLEFISSGVDFFDVVQKEDILYSFCGDEQCSSLVDGCYLVRKLSDD